MTVVVYLYTLTKHCGVQKLQFSRFRASRSLATAPKVEMPARNGDAAPSSASDAHQQVFSSKKSKPRTYVDGKARKRKKVVEDDAGSEFAVESLVASDPPEAQQEREVGAPAQKKRKKGPSPLGGADSAGKAEGTSAGVGEGTSGVTQDGHGQGASAKKKTKKKSGKGKEKATAPATDNNFQDSVIDPAFLPTVISAASASAAGDGANANAFPPSTGPQAFFTPYTYVAENGQQLPVPSGSNVQVQQGLPSFLTDGTVPITDPSFAGLQNNEDVLRALQEMDVSKLEDVLRAFGNAGMGLPPMHSQQQDQLSAVGSQPDLNALMQANGGMPALAAQLLSQPLRQKAPSSRNPSTVPMTMPRNDDASELQQILYSKWLDASKLKELVRTKGKHCLFKGMHHTDR